MADGKGKTGDRDRGAGLTCVGAGYAQEVVRVHPEIITPAGGQVGDDYGGHLADSEHRTIGTAGRAVINLVTRGACGRARRPAKGDRAGKIAANAADEYHGQVGEGKIG